MIQTYNIIIDNIFSMMGIGDWANPQSPIPNPQSPFVYSHDFYDLNYNTYCNLCKKIIILK